MDGVPAKRDGEDCLSSVLARSARKRRVPQPSRSSEQRRGVFCPQGKRPRTPGRRIDGAFLLAKQKKGTRPPGRTPGRRDGLPAAGTDSRPPGRTPGQFTVAERNAVESTSAFHRREGWQSTGFPSRLREGCFSPRTANAK